MTLVAWQGPLKGQLETLPPDEMSAARGACGITRHRGCALPVGRAIRHR
jgi:hypothetical protein